MKNLKRFAQASDFDHFKVACIDPVDWVPPKNVRRVFKLKVPINKSRTFETLNYREANELVTTCLKWTFFLFFRMMAIKRNSSLNERK